MMVGGFDGKEIKFYEPIHFSFNNKVVKNQ